MEGKSNTSGRLQHEELTGQIIGAGIHVHRELGPGFVESIYANALAIELRLRRIPLEREQLIRVLFRQEEVGRHRLDFVVKDQIVVELKAIKNFDKPTLEIKRVVAGAFARAGRLPAMPFLGSWVP